MLRGELETVIIPRGGTHGKDAQSTGSDAGRPGLSGKPRAAHGPRAGRVRGAWGRRLGTRAFVAASHGCSRHRDTAQRSCCCGRLAQARRRLSLHGRIEGARDRARGPFAHGSSLGYVVDAHRMREVGQSHRHAWSREFSRGAHARVHRGHACARARQCRRNRTALRHPRRHSIAFAKACPALHTEILDLGAVVPLAEEYILEAGLQDRVRVRPGDMRTADFGEGYDLVLLSAVCHMWGEDDNRALIKRCARALVPGGHLVIREFILNEERTAPPFAAIFAINMLVGTEHGNTYTEGEYRTWMTAAGLEIGRAHV